MRGAEQAQGWGAGGLQHARDFTACTMDALDQPRCADLLNECSRAVPSTHIIDVVRHPRVTPPHPPIAASSDHILCMMTQATLVWVSKHNGQTVYAWRGFIVLI